MPDESRNLPVVVKKMGRPPGWGFYCEEVVEEIIDRMCHGETLIAICQKDYDGRPRVRGDFPSYRTVNDWADPSTPYHHPEFVTNFGRARIMQQKCWMEMCVEIARTPHDGYEETLEVGGEAGTKLKRTRKDMLGHRKLQIDTLQQVAARCNPQLWAERLQQAASKDDGTEGPDRLIIEGGLPDNEPPPPPDKPKPPADSEGKDD